MIRTVTDSDWPQIMAIQSQVYYDVTPEPLAVMRDKWLRSPDLCFVYCAKDNPEQVGGYLLAHTWAGTSLPKLGQLLPQNDEEEFVFLHDLAISSAYQGQGVGPKLVNHLMTRAACLDWNEFRLVSVQGSAAFWQRFGFKASQLNAAACYGEDALVMHKLERAYEPV